MFSSAVCESCQRRDLNKRARLGASGAPPWPPRREPRVMFTSRGSAFVLLLMLSTIRKCATATGHTGAGGRLDTAHGPRGHGVPRGGGGQEARVCRSAGSRPARLLRRAGHAINVHAVTTCRLLGGDFGPRSASSSRPAGGGAGAKNFSAASQRGVSTVCF